MKVRIFSNDQAYLLECLVNDWLRENRETIIVKEIHYTMSLDEYSVLVVYTAL